MDFIYFRFPSPFYCIFRDIIQEKVPKLGKIFQSFKLYQKEKIFPYLPKKQASNFIIAKLLHEKVLCKNTWTAVSQLEVDIVPILLIVSW